MDYSATVFPWQEGSRFLILNDKALELKLVFLPTRVPLDNEQHRNRRPHRLG